MDSIKEIILTAEDIPFPNFYIEDKVILFVEKIANSYTRELGELSIVFCSDDYILNINRDYLQHDYYTDVITFDYCEGYTLAGDVFISLDTVLSNSHEYSVSYEEEFYRVISHSILHLIGFKDKTTEEALTMRKEEESCLKLLKTIFNG